MRKFFTPCLLVSLLCLAAAPATQPGADEDAAWAAAHEKFVRFVTPILEDARTRLNDPHIAWARVNGDLLRKYLPEHRLYVRDGAYDGKSKIWVVSKGGKISDLSDGMWISRGASSVYTVDRVVGFVKDQKIKVESAEQAIEAAKLVETIQSAPNFVGMLRLNTKDYTVFDENFLKWMYGSDSDWKFSAIKKDAIWEVAKQYIGPPAAVQQPPTYQITLDAENHFIDLQRR